MRHRQGLVLGLLTVCLVGCTTSQPVRTTAWLSRLRQISSGPTGPDVVQMDVALVERPVGDRYLNQDFWAVADEQVVALERKAMLEDNGFRVGQVGGITPVELQDLLTSERSCANPRRIQLHAGKPTTLTLGPLAPRCSFQMTQEGRPVPVNLTQAQCTLEVVPTLTADGRTLLRFTPQIAHGDTALLPAPAPDRSGWVLREQRPTERYTALSWEVELAGNEYVVIGGRFDKPQTLGYECFIRTDETVACQRLLVIRTGRTGAPADDETSSGPSLSLASQASLTTARGTAP